MIDLSTRDLQALVVYMASLCQEKPLGKKAVQKLIYILQDFHSISDGYKFDFYTYGVYSKELAGDLDILVSMNILDISYIKESKNYEIRGGLLADKYIEKSPVQRVDCKEKIDLFMDKFGKFAPWELEIISTAIFIKTTEGSEHADISERVFELKPKFELGTIRRVLRNSPLESGVN